MNAPDHIGINDSFNMAPLPFAVNSRKPEKKDVEDKLPSKLPELKTRAPKLRRRARGK
jgi:hypothetical protein